MVMWSEKGIFGTLSIFSNNFFLLFNFVVPLCYLEDMIFIIKKLSQKIDNLYQVVLGT